MNNILKRPLVNAVCIGLFSAFYTVLFFITARRTEFENILYYVRLKENTNPFWSFWSAFLAAGHQRFIAMTLAAITVFVVLLLVTRRKSYDEYHMSILINCFVAALVLTLVAIALLFLVVLGNPFGIIEKFMLFIVAHWAAVVLANLAYVLLCRWR